MFDQACKKMLINSLVQPRLDYACNLWFRPLGKVRQHKLQVCQNKSIRYILDVNNRFHLCYKQFEDLKYLNVIKRVNYLTLCQTYNIINNKCPEYLKDMFKSKDHKYNTRQQEYQVELLRVRCYGKFSFRYNGAQLWNKLPKETKNCQSKHMFKIKCKKALFNDMKAEENDIYVY